MNNESIKKEATLTIKYRLFGKNGMEWSTSITGSPSRKVKIAMLDALVNDLLPKEGSITSILTRLLR
ncbi:hypothetical protein KBC79_01470 [Candidatus Woesebacteria bacterium]|nr:hypothetical protein [Candidatus Woesebacteria bacterium]